MSRLMTENIPRGREKINQLLMAHAKLEEDCQMTCTEFALPKTIPVSEIYMNKKSPQEEAKSRVKTLTEELKKAKDALSNIGDEKSFDVLTNIGFIETIDDFRINVEREIEHMKKAELLEARRRRKEEERW